MYNKIMGKKPYIKRFFGHLKTITRHKFEVTKLCFKCGLYKQGILHDLSKLSPIEFFSGVKYYQGFRSPIDAEREDIGYSLGWLHHKGKNKHHYEYWLDKDYKNLINVCIDMPMNYMLESVCDKIAASKIYNKNYTNSSPYEFFEKGKDKIFMGEENARRLRLLLEYLKDNGEEKALKYYKSLYKEWKRNKDFNI